MPLLINPSHKILPRASEYAFNLAPPTLDLFPESSTFIKVSDGGVFEQ
jgi:hypothetical protein